MHWRLGFIWLAFTAIFLVLAIYQYQAAQQMLPHFSPGLGTGQEVMRIGSVDYAQVLRDFVSSFDDFVDRVNQSNRDANILAMYGFIAATATALFSAVIEFFVASRGK